MPLAEVDFVQSLLLLVAFSVAMAWTWTLFICFADLIGDHELSGWGKALWVRSCWEGFLLHYERASSRVV